jgi:hypothetical protein
MEFYASCSDLCSQLMEEKQTGLTKAISVQAICSGRNILLAMIEKLLPPYIHTYFYIAV